MPDNKKLANGRKPSTENIEDYLDAIGADAVGPEDYNLELHEEAEDGNAMPDLRCQSSTILHEEAEDGGGFREQMETNKTIYVTHLSVYKNRTKQSCMSPLVSICTSVH